MTTKTWTCADGNNDTGAWKFIKSNFEIDSSNRTYKVKLFGSQKTEKMRLFATNDGCVAKFVKGSSKYGLPISRIVSLEWDYKYKSKEQIFNENVNKILKHLEVDNLWTGIQLQLKMYKILGYEEANRLLLMRNHGFGDNKITFAEEYEEARKVVVKIIKGFQENNMWDELTMFNALFPLISESTVTSIMRCGVYPDGDNSIMGYLNEPDYTKLSTLFGDVEMVMACKIKKMIFHKNKYHKATTERVLETIAKAIDTKESYKSPTYSNGYDVSFEYNAEKNMAWYSEEYKGCGNGHYYLALNRTHAIYYEKD